MRRFVTLRSDQVCALGRPGRLLRWPLIDVLYRLRRLERRLAWQSSADEYLDASNREGVRALHALAERLEKYGYDGGHLFTEYSLRMLAEDTSERQAKDQETVEAWHRAQDRDREAEVAGAKEKLLAKLGAREQR